MLHFRHIWVRKEHSAKLTGRIGETHQGEIIINQTPVTGMNENQMAAFRQQHLGLIFQAYNLLPYLTAGENVALPLMFRGVEEKSRNRQAAQILKKVGQGNRMSHYPTQMSGGQQQRVELPERLRHIRRWYLPMNPQELWIQGPQKEIMAMMLKLPENTGRHWYS